ncbi:unnamed protein product, partial [Didymodactylos carnosus]
PEETKLPKRGSRKAVLHDWLTKHKIHFADNLKNSELLESIYQDALAKFYKSYQVASVYDIEILRLPVRHSTLNPIELAWSGMKNYIRPEEARGYYHHVKKYEDHLNRLISG